MQGSPTIGGSDGDQNNRVWGGALVVTFTKTRVAVYLDNRLARPKINIFVSAHILIVDRYNYSKESRYDAQILRSASQLSQIMNRIYDRTRGSVCNVSTGDS